MEFENDKDIKAEPMDNEDPKQMPLNMITGGDDLGIDVPGVDMGRKNNNGTIALLVVVIAIGGGTLMAMRMSNKPETKDAVVATAEKKVDEALKKLAETKSKKPDALDAQAIDALFQDTDQILALFSADPIGKQVGVEELQKNPFELRFSGNKEAAPETVEAPNVLRKKLAKDLANFKISSILTGSRPMAMINGKPRRVGDTLDGFRIDSIKSNEVTVSQQGEEFSLRMSKK